MIWPLDNSVKLIFSPIINPILLNIQTPSQSLSVTYFNSIIGSSHETIKKTQILKQCTSFVMEFNSSFLSYFICIAWIRNRDLMRKTFTSAFNWNWISQSAPDHRSDRLRIAYFGYTNANDFDIETNMKKGKKETKQKCSPYITLSK